MQTDSFQAQGLTRTTLALLFMAALIASSFWIMHLFLTALVWATMIVVSTWPIMLKVQGRLGGRRTYATAIMTVLLLMLLVGPFSLAINIVVANYEEISGWVQSLATVSVPPPPDGLRSLPMVGEQLFAKWQHASNIGPAGISAFLRPHAGKALAWFAAMSGTAGMMVMQFLLTVFISAIFYHRGDKAAAWLCLFARRIAGLQGEHALTLSAKAIQAVAFGVVGTAIIQTTLAGAGLLLCGIPAAAILIAIIFMLELAQIGPMPVLIPAVIWLFWKDHVIVASAMAAWTLFLSIFDNIVTPFLMKKGADLPMLLVCAGVTGGMMVFGVIGLFIGPVVLAVTYTLLDAWVTGDLPAEKNSCCEMARDVT